MVSPRKPVASVNTANRQGSRLMSTSAKSCESLFSLSSRESACLIYQRKNPISHQRCPSMKPMNTGNSAARQPSTIAASEIHQRVMSARNLRMKTFQNQLADAQAEITNLAHENRMLRTLHKRQSSALSKYESTNAELPQLLHSHAEELRVWQTKHRNLQIVNKELEQKLKQKEALILTLSDQNKHYSQLNKDKNLDERQRLQEKLRNLEQRLVDKDNDMKLMSRKVQLESKNFRQQLLNEQKKSKEIMLKLEKLKLELSGYRKLEEYTLAAEKNMPISTRRGKLTVSDEPDKIDKLEKSLETLEKAIEKNNQSEYNALTDVLETDSLFDFEKDDQDREEKIPSPTPSPPPQLPSGGQPEQDGSAKMSRVGSTLSKLTLPATTPKPNPMPQPPSTRSALSQALSIKSPGPSASKPFSPTANRLRAGNLRNGGSTIILGSKPGKRHEVDSLSRGSIPEGKGRNVTRKSMEMRSGMEEEYVFGDKYDHQHIEDEEISLSIMATFSGGEDDEGENANDMSLLNYSAYMSSKSGNGNLDDMLEEDEGDDDHARDSESAESMEESKGSKRGNTPSMKEDVSSIRKQISDDYKKRESFLNTFCRPATGSNMREDPTLKKRNSIATGAGNLISGNRKHDLLAALKVLDNNKSQD